MKRVTQIVLFLLIGTFLTQHADAQKTDTAKGVKDNTTHVYFIINADEVITAFYADKPVQDVSKLDDFNNYVQKNAKSMVNSWVIVTGKPKTGTYDEVMKTLKRNRFKHISTNIKN